MDQGTWYVHTWYHRFRGSGGYMPGSRGRARILNPLFLLYLPPKSEPLGVFVTSEGTRTRISHALATCCICETSRGQGGWVVGWWVGGCAVRAASNSARYCHQTSRAHLNCICLCPYQVLSHSALMICTSVTPPDNRAINCC